MLRRRDLSPFLAAVLALVLIAAPAAAEGGVLTVFDAVSAASGSSGPINTSGAYTLNVQVCGTGYSGGVSIK